MVLLTALLQTVGTLLQVSADGLGSFGAALGIGLAAISAGYGIGKIGIATMEGISRQPENRGRLPWPARHPRPEWFQSTGRPPRPHPCRQTPACSRSRQRRRPHAPGSPAAQLFLWQAHHGALAGTTRRQRARSGLHRSGETTPPPAALACGRPRPESATPPPATVERN